MPKAEIPTGNISNNVADIYAASLTYEKMGKCGDATGNQSIILTSGETWNHAVDGGAKGWKLVALQNNSILIALNADNLSVAAETALCGITWGGMIEVMASGDGPGDGFTLVSVEEGTFILYKDCSQS